MATGNARGPFRRSRAAADHVFDLATQRVTPLAETRSVDDQAAWLDNATVGYALQRSDGTNDLWTTPADGSGAPPLLVQDANSPAALG